MGEFRLPRHLAKHPDVIIFPKDLFGPFRRDKVYRSTQPEFSSVISAHGTGG